MAYDPARGVTASGEAAQRDHLSDALNEVDRHIRGRFGQIMGGQSMWVALQAWEDWIFHSLASPGRQAKLAWRWADRLGAIGRSELGATDADAETKPVDRRFRAESWKQWPYSIFANAQLAIEAQWRDAARDVRGVSEHHARRVEFMGQFLLNALAPVNFAGTNPEVIETTWRTGGASAAAGAALMADDVLRLTTGRRLRGLDDWRVGETMALTPGRVVYRNKLFELIQYAPRTGAVRKEPILIVPAWIMKYYILDLTPQESFVGYLVDQGFTVFIMSWRNPGREMRDTRFEDYRVRGVLEAINAVAAEVPGQKIHGVGYCLGGTILAVTAAAMDRDGDARLASLTLLAAQVDFEEAGELLMFIDESQLALLEDMMHVAGYLDARRMAGVFYALRANELLFAKLVERYLLGRPSQPSALDAWLADPTRMPARMHSEYLRQLFLEDRFAHGNYDVDGKAVALKDIRLPIFALGAERDHIAPWRSVYKTELYKSAETTFVLTGGGHNSSVVSPPGKPGAYYWKSVSPPGGDYVDPESWLASSLRQDGSWWPVWRDWLISKSEPELVPAHHPRPRRSGGKALGDSPGAYVLET